MHCLTNTFKDRCLVISLIIVWIFTVGREASALGLKDPSMVSLSDRFGVGFELGFDHREIDTGETLQSSKFMGEFSLTLTENIEVFLKTGLFQIDTFEGHSSDWGLGAGMGIRGWFAEFQGGNVRFGFDGQIYRGQTAYSDQNVRSRFSLDEDITLTEYQLSAIVSWRAYTPLALYTGIVFSKFDLEYETTLYNWDEPEPEKTVQDVNEDQAVGLMWGINYQFSDNVEMFGEMKVIGDINAAFGVQFLF